MSPEILAALISALIALIGYLVTTDRTRREISVEKRKLELSLDELDVKKRDLEIKSQAINSQIESAARELELKREELDTLRSQLEQGLEDMRQEQFAEILKRRLDAYPKIYQALQKYNRIWRFSGAPLDHGWAKQFLEAMLDCNAAYGVLFSQSVYSSFADLRNFLYELEERLRDGGTATEEDIERIDGVISGPLNEAKTKRGPGLGSYMKDDLGSYRTIAISARHA